MTNSSKNTSLGSQRLTLTLAFFLLLSSSRALTDLVRYKNTLNKSEVDDIALIDMFAPDGNSRISEYYGLAYDMFTGNPKSETVDPGFQPKSVFALTYNNLKKTADDLFFIPDQITSIGDLSCTFSSSTATYTSMSSYQKDLSASVNAKAGYKSFACSASFSMSAEYEQMKNSIESEEKVAIVVEAKCILYHASLLQNAPLSPDFLAAVAQAWQLKSFDDFLERWGTHYAREVDFGAQAIQRSFFTRKDVQELESQKINVAAAVSFKGFGNSLKASVKSSMSQEQEERFSSTSRETRESYVGLAPPESGDAREWLGKIRKSDPVPIDFKLGAIVDLFTTDYFGSLYSAADLNSMRSLYTTAVQLKATSTNMVGPSADVITFQTSVTSSALVGRTLTMDGNYFKDPQMSNSNLRTKFITVRSGNAIDAIRITLTDGVNDYPLPQRGGNGGGQYQLTIPKSITIDYVEVWSDPNAIRAIKFTFSDGSQSSTFGEATGTYTNIDVKGYIVGMEGYADNLLRGFRFIKRNTRYVVANGFSQKKSQLVGAPQGIKFEDPDRPLPEFKTKRIVVYTRENNVEGVQVILNLRSDTDIEVTSDFRGLSEGRLNSFDVPAGKFIKNATIWADGSYIKGIKIVLNDATSRTLGLEQGNPTVFNIDGHITGFYGYNTRFIRSLGLKYTNEI